MQSVRIRSGNLKVGDVVNGSRVKFVYKNKRRTRKANAHKLETVGVTFGVVHPDGYDMCVSVNIPGSRHMVVARPQRNMEFRRPKSRLA